MEEAKKKRGRPPLTPEQKKVSVERKRERDKGYKKASGYVHQKNYRNSRYEPKISIPATKKDSLMLLVKQENTSITGLFVSLIKDKYGVDLS